MIRFLYINGMLMPDPPSDVVCSHENESEVVRLSDGGHHVIPYGSEPLQLSVKFPLYKDRQTYKDTEFSDADDAVGFLSDAVNEPFELLLLGDDIDINITAAALDLSFSYKKDKAEVTLKLREYRTEAEL